MSEETGPAEASPLARRLRRGVWVVTFVVAAVVIAGGPVRGWWEQRADIETAEADLERLREDNAALESRLERTRDPVEVERMARTELGMVREGEESYTVLPPPTSGLVLPDVWPFDRLAPVLTETP